MFTLIILNIILICLLIYLIIYFIKNKKNSVKDIFCINDENCNENENIKYKKNNKINSERVFDGKFVTDEEYQQIMKNRRNDISILLDEVKREYEYLKELNNYGKE